MALNRKYLRGVFLQADTSELSETVGDYEVSYQVIYYRIVGDYEAS